MTREISTVPVCGRAVRRRNEVFLDKAKYVHGLWIKAEIMDMGRVPYGVLIGYAPMSIISAFILIIYVLRIFCILHVHVRTKLMFTYKIFEYFGIFLCNRYFYRNWTCCNVIGY